VNVRWTWREAPLLVLCLITSSAQAVETPIELRPYRVEILLADESDDPTLRDELAAMSDRTWGGRWSLHIDARTAAPWMSERLFERLQPDDLAASNDADVDVRYLVWVSPQPAGVKLSIRAWEPLWGHLSPVVSDSVYDRRAAPLRILQLCRQLFRPRATWEKHDDQTARIAVQAAALAGPDPEFAVLQPEEAFVPWMILRKRDGTIQRQQAISWTYFVAQELTDGRGLATVVSGLRSPHGAKPRGRIELVAVAARPQWSQTRLECFSQSQPPRPLAAHRVEWLPVETSTEAGTTKESEESPRPQVLVTDRGGSLRFAVEDYPDLLWASVYSGSLRLARVPLLPGSAPVARLDLPDDAIRLQAEGQLQLLQSELVDVVALRTLLVATARAAGKRSDWKTANEKLALAKRLSAPQPFLEQVSAVRVPAVAEALKRKDRTTEQRVIRMCEETIELIRRYLDEDRLRLVQEELDELQAADKEISAEVRGANQSAKTAAPPAASEPAPKTKSAPKAGGF
jgi:hypothetical protein